MADYDLTPETTAGKAPTARYKGVQVLTSQVVDVANRAAAANTYQLFDLPAGTVVLAAKMTILEPASAALTIDVGLAGDPNGWIAASDATAAAGTTTGAGTEAYLVGTVGGNALAAGTVVATQSAATVYTAGKFTVTLVVAGIQ